jgi:hypothetical protein
MLDELYAEEARAVRSRDIDAIDRELSLLAAVRASLREGGALPSMRAVDELLDERLAHRGRPVNHSAVFD